MTSDLELERKVLELEQAESRITAEYSDKLSRAGVPYMGIREVGSLPRFDWLIARYEEMRRVLKDIVSFIEAPEHVAGLRAATGAGYRWSDDFVQRTTLLLNRAKKLIDLEHQDNGEYEHECFKPGEPSGACMGDGWFRCPECRTYYDGGEDNGRK